jgi:asparagine synthase (glutamine-hydrolysing)
MEAQLRVYEINPPTEKKLLEAISACDGPMHALAFYPIWELYGFIRENGVKVTLDGQGPDEMMGGYFETVQSALRAALSQGKLGWFWDIYKTYSEQGENSFRSSKGLAKSELLRLFKSPLSRVKRLVVSGFANGSTASKDTLEYAQPTPSGLSAFSAELYNQFCRKQLPTILQQYDRCSMSHGVECRMPFMDYRLVEFVFSLPDSSLVGGGFTKRILREAVRGLVPDATRLNKVKIGFNAPIVEWFLGPLRPLVLDVMSSSEFRQSRFFEGPRLIKEFEAWLNAPTWGEAWAFWPPVHMILWQRQMKTALAGSKDDRMAAHG